MIKLADPTIGVLKTQLLMDADKLKKEIYDLELRIGGLCMTPLKYREQRKQKFKEQIKIKVEELEGMEEEYNSLEND